ncbi:structural maintenance of chromosomes protein [Plakobranchus ocellatus]|uniref:Structural maintenance of chromosomes protein n=1 Tax=Plakobranchus ocellatus TaxID=259542 RepID=A0AAV4B8Q1_9GAST|nr:structural maintenance of chromosomes protein [Plakobranchus ocellatus]
MPGYLKYIEVENFKSYRGKQTIGPFKQFTAIIGPNGSGKSNLMDAISFVMGEKTSNLRSKRLSDLIHGAPIGQPASNKATVIAVYYDNEADRETHFQRIINNNSSEYRIDGHSVTPAQYNEALEKIGILIKAKNFLVFQGTVESIAMKNAKERTAMFEDICKSGEMKDEYEKAKAEMLKAEEDTQFNLNKKKGIAAERKEARLEKEEAERYQRLTEQLAEKQLELQLFKLFHNEREIEEIGDELSKKSRVLEKENKRRDKIEAEIKEKKKEQGLISRELTKLEQQIKESETALNKKRPQYIKAKEQTSHMTKKLDASKKSLKQAVKKHENHNQTVAEIQKELEEAREKKRSFEEELEEESQSQGRSLQLEESQVQQYNRLKEEAGRRAAEYMQELDAIIRDQKMEQDRLDASLRDLTAYQNKLKQRHTELEENKARVAKLEDYITTSRSALEDQRKVEQELAREVNESSSRMDEITRELESVTSQLGEAKVQQYNRLKEEAGRRAAEYMQELDAIIRDQKMEQDRLDASLRDLTAYQNKLKQRHTELEENKARVAKLEDYITTSRSALEDQRKVEQELAREVNESSSRMDEITRELESVTSQLGEAKVDRTESTRATKKAELVDTLKGRYPGVHGRLIDLCVPSHKKYQIAITKVLGKHMDSIPDQQKLERSIDAREVDIKQLRDEMNRVEDAVFKDFCAVIGVPNIRHYEERELRAQQDRARRRMEFENTIHKLDNQLECEKSQDTEELVNKWKDTVKHNEKEVERVKEEEARQMQIIEEEMQRQEKLKQSKLTSKSQVDDMEAEINEVRKRLTVQQKEIAQVQKGINQMEVKLEQRRADRHSLLKSCKMEDIRVPMRRGTMDDIEGEGVDGSQETPMDSLSSQGAKAIYEKEAALDIDYSLLSEDHKELDSGEEVKSVQDTMTKQISDLQTTIQKINAPNMRAMEKLDGVKERFMETSEEFENARRRARTAKTTFERIRKKRYDTFMHCFDHVSTKIDEVYKSLARNQSAQAFLGPENPEEPYLDGINYNCVAPGKRFRPMDNLSGGEKTVAALALLFSINSYQQSPFFVLDEIDAALDNTNIGKVAAYIREQSEKNFQCIVISLKEEFYNRADALIGIYPEQGDCVISNSLTLDLTEYPDPHAHEHDENYFPTH